MKSIAEFGLGGVVKLGGSHTWGATRRYLLKEGFAEAKVPLHHWLLHQGEGLGKRLPRWLINQPWNLISLDSEIHTVLHAGRLSPLTRFAIGTPRWFKIGLVEVGLREGRDRLQPQGNCPCD